ncbi:hypothetical protein IP84_16460 [beta proteobacterium AAP99]|nr:hypothetical protein IP84_16460 [beta proteobacterium AAP99]
MNIDDLTPKDGDFVREVERIQARMQALNVGQQLTDVSGSARRPASGRPRPAAASASGPPTAPQPAALAAQNAGARAVMSGDKPPLTRAEAEALLNAMRSGEVDVRQWFKTPMGVAVLVGGSLFGAGVLSLILDLPYFLALAIIGGIAFSVLNPKKK